MFRVHTVLVPFTIRIKCIQKQNISKFLETFGLWEKRFDWHTHIVLILVIIFALRHT